MARTHRGGDVRSTSMGLVPRFVLTMTLALAVVTIVAGFLLYGTSATLAENVLEETLERAVHLTAKMGDKPRFEQVGTQVKTDSVTGVQSTPVRFGDGGDRAGLLYQYRYRGGSAEGEERLLQLFVPGGIARSDEGLLGLIFAVTILVIVVGAAVALWVARQVAGPILEIVDDVRHISRGDLQTAVTSGRGGAAEIEILARSIDRMREDLAEAQEDRLELSIREREMELAGGVREALLPVATPLVPGYDIGSSHLSSSRFGGDFHDYIEREDGKLGMLVCDVSGTGVPAALVGATARSYLRSHLLHDTDLQASLCAINRELARDMRRGMFVTALYALLDRERGVVSVACAGHKIPLLRYTVADQKLRLVHPEGIALGFDNGPVFERALQVQQIPIAAGDRLVLSNSGPVKAPGPSGDELGEKPFFGLVLKHAGLDTGRFLKGLRRALEEFAGDEGFPEDVSLVTVQREA